MKTPDAHALPLHESAHAVVGRHMGLRVDKITLTPRRGYAGLCYLTALNAPARNGAVLLLTLAGPWAEARYLQMPGGVFPPSADSDLAVATKLARDLVGDHWEVGLSTAFKTVARLLAEPEIHRQVSRLTWELKGRQVITGTELDVMCRTADRPLWA